MTRSPVRRLVFSLLRRVLYLWVRSETINQSAFTLKLDRSTPVFYVLSVGLAALRFKRRKQEIKHEFKPES